MSIRYIIQELQPETKMFPELDTSKYSYFVTTYYLNNPYRVLGISCDADYDEALCAAEEWREYARIGSQDLYFSNYDVLGEPLPNRSLDNINAALSQIKDSRYKCLWFSRPYNLDADKTNGISNWNFYLFLQILINENEKDTSKFWNDNIGKIDNYISSNTENIKDILELTVEYINEQSLLRVLLIGQSIVNLQSSNFDSIQDRIGRILLKKIQLEKDKLEDKEINDLRICYEALMSYRSIYKPSEIIYDRFSKEIQVLYSILLEKADEQKNMEILKILYKNSDTVQKLKISNKYGNYNFIDINADSQGWELYQKAKSYTQEPDKDMYMAALYYTQASYAGYADAQAELGKCYECGSGIGEDINMALHWYEEAAKNGSHEGMIRLSSCYYYGNGVDKNIAKSKELLAEAIRRGSVAARFLYNNRYTN